jgi:hypothetical protein
MRVHLNSVQPQVLCATLEALVRENTALEELRYSDQRSGSMLRILLGELTSLLGGPGGFPHIEDALERLRRVIKDAAGYEQAIQTIEAAKHRLQRILECQREFLYNWNLDFKEPGWVSFAEVPDLVNIKMRKKDLLLLRQRPELGVYTDRTIVTDAIQEGHRFLDSWGDAVRSTCRHAQQESQMVFELFTTRATVDAPVDDFVGSHMPAPNRFDECGVAPKDWAKLAWSALRLRSIGGNMSLRPHEERARNRRQYLLEIRIPCDEVPFWKL